MTLTAAFFWMAVLFLNGVWIGWAFGFIHGRKVNREEFDKEVQETALAKTNRILHDANRTTLPRHDTTGPAKIHRGVNARKPQHRKKS